MDLKDLDITLELVHRVFLENADTFKAKEMQRYMKNRFHFLGIQKPDRDLLEAAFINECKKLPFHEISYLVKKLWDKKEREFLYTAFQLMEKAKLWQHEESLELFEWALLRHSWWDSVDSVTTRLIGPYFLAFPQNRIKKTEEWKNSENMWANRCAILFQLKYKKQTDISLLTELIDHFADSKEFFIQKAIGWALRQLSYTYPDLVVEICNSKPLSNLSKREAAKALNRKSHKPSKN